MTRLTAADLTRWLLDRGLITHADVVDFGVTVVDSSRSHSLLVVRVGRDGRLVVKQPAGERGAGSRGLEREVSIYALTASRPALAAALPAHHPSVGLPGVLVLEFVTPGETLFEHHYRVNACPAGHATALGTALGSAHRDLAGPPAPDLPRHLPWILDLFNPEMAAFAWTTAGTREVLAAFPDQRRLRTLLEAARGRWRAESVIHGDLKWDNCLLGRGSDGQPVVKLVDWELAGVGDPAWDVAGALHEYAAFAAVRSPRGRVGDADTPEMRRAIEAFWRAYRDAAGWGFDDGGETAARAALFAGARLVQTSLEYAAQFGADTPAAATLLEVGMQVLEEPSGHFESVHARGVG